MFLEQLPRDTSLWEGVASARRKEYERLRELHFAHPAEGVPEDVDLSINNPLSQAEDVCVAVCACVPGIVDERGSRIRGGGGGVPVRACATFTGSG